MSAEHQASQSIFQCTLDRESVARLRVLLVDDLQVARIAARLLTACPRVLSVATAGNGHDAIEAVSKQHPDLVLMDVMMPQMNGLKAASRIRKKLPSARIVLFSTDDFPGLRELVKTSGGDAFVPKCRLTQQFCGLLQQLCGSCRENYASEP
jgi:CheY-like chemotaxis protein